MAQNIIDLFCELIEVTVHNILRTRNVYPETAFLRRVKYGVLVHKSMHTGLNSYIEHIIKSVHFHLERNELKKIFLSIHSGPVAEKYVFEINNILPDVVDDELYIKIEQFLRSFLLKLQTTNEYLGKVTQDRTFNVRLQLSEESLQEMYTDSIYDDFPWLQLFQNDEKPLNIIPLDNIETSNINMQIFIEKVG